MSRSKQKRVFQIETEAITQKKKKSRRRRILVVSYLLGWASGRILFLVGPVKVFIKEAQPSTVNDPVTLLSARLQQCKEVLAAQRRNTVHGARLVEATVARWALGRWHTMRTWPTGANGPKSGGACVRMRPVVRVRGRSGWAGHRRRRLRVPRSREPLGSAGLDARAATRGSGSKA